MPRVHIRTNAATGETTQVPFTPEEEAAADAAEANPVLPEPVPSIYAMALLTTADGDIASITTSAKLAGGFRVDTGIYWMFFTEEQPDTDYLALCYDGGSTRAFVNTEDKFTDFFIITVTDAAGVAIDPPALSVEIKRVV